MPARSDNLPRYLTRFIGREREVEQLNRLLTSTSTTRLITLTGAGGCGKTRLATELARALTGHDAGEKEGLFCDGVSWVGLSSLSDPAQVPQTVAAALGLREARGRSPARALLASLRQASFLLVLDNCEHLARACGALAQKLLAGCPGLVTDQASLQ